MRKFTDPNEKFQWLTTAPIPGLIGRLAIPTIISMLITSIYNMADTYFVGTMGKSAQGAVSVVMPLMAIIQAIGFTFGNGAGNCVSRLLGQQKVEEAEVVAATGFFSSVFGGLILTVLGELFLAPLVELLGATDTILPYAVAYARYILMGAPWMIGSIVLNNLLRFSGSATYAMVGITAGGILNMLLDPIFITVLDLGTAGAALATIVSQMVSFLLLLFNTGRNGTIPVRWSRFRLRGGPVFEVVRGGLPSMYRQGLASVATILLNWAAKPFGDAAIAAMGIVNKVAMFSGSAVIGFGQGFQPVCGFNYGAKLYHRVREAFWFCVRVGTAFLVVVSAVVFLLSPQIVYRFQPKDGEVVALGTAALRCAIVALPLLPYTVLNNMMLQTVGETARASVLSMARQGLFFVPAILILPRMLEFTGVMLAQPIADVGAFLLAIPLSVGFFRKIRRLEEENTLQK